ncbi:hypothetical protein [Rhodococcus sp. NPDC058639]|uniref:hypothetical protein n=1 Tax=Rhodococcus sp. NPDC058639 TaxID=3346570 RepID=UPI00365906D8
MTAGSVDHVYEDSSATILSTLDAGRREAVEAIDALVDLGRAVRGGLTDGT